MIKILEEPLRKRHSVILLFFLSTLSPVALRPLQSAATETFCPSDRIVRVAHIDTGRSSDARRQLEAWLAKIVDGGLNTEVSEAFKGRICVGSKLLLEELVRMSKNAPPGLRADTVKVLSMHSAAEARQIVREALFDSASAVRVQALVGIGQACDRAALSDIDHLIRRGDESAEFVQLAERILERLNQNPPCEPLPWLRPSAE